MKKLTLHFVALSLIILMAGCKGCSKKKQEQELEQYITNANTPPVEQKLILDNGFLGKCAMAFTGTNDQFKIKVKVRGISGYDANLMPITYTYRSYIWPGISSSSSSYTNGIEIPNTGGFFIDVSVESVSCVKCCTDPTSCPTNFGNVELSASMLINGTLTVPNPIVLPATSFTKTCY